MSELDILRIMEILPHRYPLLLVDRVIEFEAGVRALGYKNVSYNEPIFSGHFPGNPVLPGVYTIEALAQLGGIIVLEPGEWKRKVPYLTGIDKAKFRRPVLPGDRLMMDVFIGKQKRNIGWVHAKATVDGDLVCSADLMFSISANQRASGIDAAVMRS